MRSLEHFRRLPTARTWGIVTMNKVVNRVIFAVSAAVLLIAGLIPGLSAAPTTIPQCVIGGATLSVFAQIAMTGVRLFTKDGMTARKTTVVGMSVALGVGITQVSGCLRDLESGVDQYTYLEVRPVVVAAIMAIILNLTLPPEE
ncbi:MAG: solute carrier family 23 protein [Clostridium sp.]